MITPSTIFELMNLDQLYAIGMQFARYELLELSIELKNYIDAKYGVISADYMQNLVECEETAKGFTRTLPRVVYSPVGLGKNIVDMILVMPVHYFIELEYKFINCDKITLLDFERINHLKSQFLRTNIGATA